MREHSDNRGTEKSDSTANDGEGSGFVYLADREEAFPLVARWYYDEWGHLAETPTVEYTARGLRDYLNRGQIPFVLLAMRGEEVIGAAQLKYREMAPRFMDREHWLGGVYIAAGHRDQGCAARLVERVVARAVDLGVRTLSLQTLRLDGGLYARLGWVPVTVVDNKGVEVLVMERHVGP